jgi:large subunit ribosomal protein L1
MPKKKEEKEKKIKSSGKGEKFADMSATAVVIDEAAIEKELQQEVKPLETAKRNKVRGKKYQATLKLLDKNKIYSLKEALELLQKISFAKFGGSVEVHLNVTAKGISGEAKLPYFAGKTQKVAIFDEKILAEIKAGKINFDVLLATPADMPKILPFAKILGPKGLLPSPKNGTVTSDPQKAAEKFSGNTLRYKTEKDFPLIHLVIGKINQPVEELTANFEALIKAINPKNIKKAYLKSTMSPSLKVSF